MSEKTYLRKLLVLQGPAMESEGVLDFLREHFDVEVVRELDAALDAMREKHFDAVLAETADFLPLERGVVTQQAAVVLETIGDGVCMVGSGGEIVWANRRLKDFSPKVLGELRKLCVKAYEEFATGKPSPGQPGRRYSLMPESGEYYEVICSPVRDRQGLLRQVAVVIVDATQQRRQQNKINAIDQAGRELVRLDYANLSDRDAADRLHLLQERIIHYIRDVLDFQHFALMLLDESTNRLEMVISEGFEKEDPVGRSLFASTENNGISGYVAATGRSYICPDIRKDSRYLPGLTNARSSLTVPLRLHGKIIGVLNVESDIPSSFSEDDRQFAEIFANYIAMAMNVLNLLVFERHTTHTQLSGSVSAELAGPLNDIITEAGELVEDYIGHDDLRQRLTGIIDLATEAKAYVKSLHEGHKTGVLGRTGGNADPILAGKKVLIADDESLIRETIRDVLVSCGCNVETAADGTEAKNKLAASRYDLVISDIKMPCANGYEVFAAAKDSCPNTQVILITAFGYDPHHSVVRARKEGLAAVLMKPFKVKQLLDQCRAALAAKPR